MVIEKRKIPIVFQSALCHFNIHYIPLKKQLFVYVVSDDGIYGLFRSE